MNFPVVSTASINHYSKFSKFCSSGNVHSIFGNDLKNIIMNLPREDTEDELYQLWKNSSDGFVDEVSTYNVTTEIVRTGDDQTDSAMLLEAIYNMPTHQQTIQRSERPVRNVLRIMPRRTSSRKTSRTTRIDEGIFEMQQKGQRLQQQIEPRKQKDEEYWKKRKANNESKHASKNEKRLEICFLANLINTIAKNQNENLHVEVEGIDKKRCCGETLYPLHVMLYYIGENQRLVEIAREIDKFNKAEFKHETIQRDCAKCNYLIQVAQILGVQFTFRPHTGREPRNKITQNNSIDSCKYKVCQNDPVINKRRFEIIKEGKECYETFTENIGTRKK